MFNIYEKGKEILKIITDGARTAPTLRHITEIETAEFLSSEKRRRMLEGEAYYIGKHDIKNKKRGGYFADGGRKPNSIIVDNQYKKMIDQKANYLLGRPFTIDTDNPDYEKRLNAAFGDEFQKKILTLGKNAMNCGIAWLYVYIDEQGKLEFKIFPSEQILPFWKDDEHTDLDFAIRIYEVEVYEGDNKITRQYAEKYSSNGVEYYVYEGGRLIDNVAKSPHTYFSATNAEGETTNYNWRHIPLIAFKYNPEELPLIINCKSIQDAINELLSACQDTMLESSRTTILILKNYDGENLEKFRRNLNEYGVVKVRTVSGIEGGVDSLSVEFKPENHKAVLEILKKAMIENAMGYDAKDDRLGSNANQMNLRSMYSDIDLDAYTMETEFQKSMTAVLSLVCDYLYNTGAGDFENECAKIIFNRDVMINESDKMSMLLNAGVRISQRTLLSQVPFIDDVQAELDRVADEDAESATVYGDDFISGVTAND